MILNARRALCACSLAAIVLGQTAAAAAQELVFATAATAREVLGSKDAFVERMSGFDRAARLKTDRTVTESEYLRFAASAALDWTDAEKRRITRAYLAISDDLARLRLPLPPQVLFIQTTGEEEGNTGYTRANAVILPHAVFFENLPKLLAHELFHVASRHHPSLAEKLYATIGFRPCGEAAYPPELALRKLTNPDAPRNDYCVGVKLDGRDVSATPILFSRSAAYDRASGGEFFEYLQLGILIRGGAASSAVDEPARVVGLNQVSGFFEQVGQNTDYVIHPEEILADNFSLLATGAENVRSPAILAEIQRALTELDATTRR